MKALRDIEMAEPATRQAYDLLGARDVPRNAYYGIHTLRALENFPITGQPISTHTSLTDALAAIKQAAAQTNLDLSLLGGERAGNLHDQFGRRVYDLVLDRKLLKREQLDDALSGLGLLPPSATQKLAESR